MSEKLKSERKCVYCNQVFAKAGIKSINTQWILSDHEENASIGYIKSGEAEPNRMKRFGMRC